MAGANAIFQTSKCYPLASRQMKHCALELMTKPANKTEPCNDAGNAFGGCQAKVKKD